MMGMYLDLGQLNHNVFLEKYLMEELLMEAMKNYQLTLIFIP